MLTGLDCAKLFEPIIKMSIQVKSAEKLPEIIRRAFRVAYSGKSVPSTYGSLMTCWSQISTLKGCRFTSNTTAQPFRPIRPARHLASSKV